MRSSEDESRSNHSSTSKRSPISGTRNDNPSRWFTQRTQEAGTTSTHAGKTGPSTENPSTGNPKVVIGDDTGYKICELLWGRCKSTPTLFTMINKIPKQR
uniref:Uncharacterized protein n=1 Tax=Cannabis sativa TaxID=3483 RepID=A0A803PL68_CANSA